MYHSSLHSYSTHFTNSHSLTHPMGILPTASKVKAGGNSSKGLGKFVAGAAKIASWNSVKESGAKMRGRAATFWQSTASLWGGGSSEVSEFLRAHDLAEMEPILKKHAIPMGSVDDLGTLTEENMRLFEELQDEEDGIFKIGLVRRLLHAVATHQARQEATKARREGKGEGEFGNGAQPSAPAGEGEGELKAGGGDGDGEEDESDTY